MSTPDPTYGPTPAHQHWRDQLGALSLGHLTAAEAAAVQAHLDGCARCRAELAEIAPLAGLLDAIDPARFAAPPAPAPELGARIRAAVVTEQADRDRAGEADDLARHRATARRRRTTRAGLLASAAALVVVALVTGLLVGRSTDPDPGPTAAPRPYEAITMRDVGGTTVAVDRAGLVPHTWGVELELEAAGFSDGSTYRAWFRTSGPDAGGGGDAMVPAGEFQGIGAGELTCHLQSSVLRDDVDRVVVTDARGRRVLVADLS